MEMQRPPVLRPRPAVSKWSNPVDEEQPGHLINELGPSKRPVAAESSETNDEGRRDDFPKNEKRSRPPQHSKVNSGPQKDKSPGLSASLMSRVPQRSGLSVAPKLLCDIPDAALRESVCSSEPVGLEPQRDYTTATQFPLPMKTTQANAAVDPAVEGLGNSLILEHQLSQLPALDLAVQGGSIPLPIQNRLENEVRLVGQDLPQLDAGMRTADQQRPWFRNPWKPLNSETQEPFSGASIGRSLNLKSLGSNRCWEVKGPAREVWDRILPDITRILDCCGEDLVAQEPVPLPILVGMYMIGKDERNAAPTILFSCQSRALRRKAMKFVKKSNLFQNLQGVLLAESKETPSSIGSSKEPVQLSSIEQHQMTNIYAVAPTSIESPCGTRIFLANEKDWPFTFTSVATMGGVLQQGGSYCGLTVAHSFLVTDGVPISSEDSVDFSFDDSDDSENLEDSENVSDSGRLLPARRQPESYLGPDIVRLGCTSKLPFNNDLDYAVIAIDLDSFKAPNRISWNVNGKTQYTHLQEISQVPTKDCEVLAVTGSKGVIKGEISGVPYIMKMPFGKKFQEVRLVILEDIIEHGDCGSWVVDLENGKLYGVVVSGYPNTKIAYIIPAMGILEDIRLRTNMDVTLSRPMEASKQNPFQTSHPKDQTTKRSARLPNYLYEKAKKTVTKKHKTKSNRPASNPRELIPSLATEMPDNMGFLWSIDSIETIYDEKQPARILSAGGSKGNDVARFWFPPNHTRNFKRRRGNLYRWSMGESELLDKYNPPSDKFAVTSLFFQARQNNFVAVNKDCTLHDIAEEEFGWSYIGFEHLPGHLSGVFIGAENFTLAAPANRLSWMPQVLPEVYNYDTKSPQSQPPREPGGLCGSLSLLIAMAAFSAPVHSAETIVSKCFGLNEWIKHNYEIGIGRTYYPNPNRYLKAFSLHSEGYQERGVVVTIYLDPEAEGVTANHLRAFERGLYGPIFGPFERTIPQLHYKPKESLQSLTYSQTPVPQTLDPQLVPRSFSYYALGQHPAVSTEQYDTFVSNPKWADEDEKMDEPNNIW